MRMSPPSTHSLPLSWRLSPPRPVNSLSAKFSRRTTRCTSRSNASLALAPSISSCSPPSSRSAPPLLFCRHHRRTCEVSCWRCSWRYSKRRPSRRKVALPPLPSSNSYSPSIMPTRRRSGARASSSRVFSSRAPDGNRIRRLMRARWRTRLRTSAGKRCGASPILYLLSC